MSEGMSFRQWQRWRNHILDLTQQELADPVVCASITLRQIEAGGLKPPKYWHKFFRKTWHVVIQQN